MDHSVDGLTPEQLGAIQDYTSNSDPFNNPLRGQEPMTSAVHDAMPHLDGALTLNPRLGKLSIGKGSPRPPRSKPLCSHRSDRSML